MDTRCKLEDLQGAMDDRDDWRERERESQGNPCQLRDDDDNLFFYNKF